MSALRWMSAVLAAVLAAGPLAPMIAAAQAPLTAPAPPPPPPGPTATAAGSGNRPPTPPTAPPATVTPPPSSATAPLQPMESMQPDTLVGAGVPAPGTGAKIGAGVLNVVYVPGKAIVCGAGTVVAGVFMLATFGSAYREATSFFKEGCSGAWLVTPEEVAAVAEEGPVRILSVRSRRPPGRAARHPLGGAPAVRRAARRIRRRHLGHLPRDLSRQGSLSRHGNLPEPSRRDPDSRPARPRRRAHGAR